MVLPKPMPCAQNWDNMQPTVGGRLCAQCDKVITNFTNKKWNESVHLQSHNKNQLCGYYTDKQLYYWGQEPAKLDWIPRKWMAIRSVFVAAFALPDHNVLGQDIQSYEFHNNISEYE